MHPYTTDNDRTRFLYAWIAVLGIMCAYALYLLLKTTGLSDTLWFVDVPAVPGFMVLFYKLFDSKLWNKALSRKVGINCTPDFSGEWNGELRSSHDQFTKQTPVRLRVEQTASHISLVLSSDNSRSESCLAMIFTKSPDNGATIQYAYLNRPTNTAVRTMHTHEGTATLSLSEDGKTLTGNYYTGRDRENHGTLKLTKVTDAC